MSQDAWLEGLLLALCIWLLVSGLDDLAITLAYCSSRIKARWRSPGSPGCETQFPAEARRAAIFVPLWHEHEVILKMLEHNLAAIRYENYDIFLGAYPNDPRTLLAVRAAERRWPRVHVIMCPHNGPTSKADCLNAIYTGMLRFEQSGGARFDFVVIHDAEDVIHPDTLRVLNFHLARQDMAQVPVLGLRTAPCTWTRSVYCDDFAEFQSKDVPARLRWKGFLPGNGVGTGFSRCMLDRLRRRYPEGIFDPQSHTEDYKTGYRVYLLGGPQVFIPLRGEPPEFVATREAFPNEWRAAVRQRSRWVTGIALETWATEGWGRNWREAYWFWRDRKGLVGNLLAPVTNLLMLAWLMGTPLPGISGWTVWLWRVNLLLGLFQIAVRVECVRSVYGWRFAAAVPLRVLWANLLNCAATVMALEKYLLARMRSRPLPWLKTDHDYPDRPELNPHKRRLGEILHLLYGVSHPDLAEALQGKSNAERLGEYLVRRGRLQEREVYSALAMQQSLPFDGLPRSAVDRRVVRSLPGKVARKWKVLPYRVASGAMRFATAEVPDADMLRDLRRYTALELEFHLVTPGEIEQLLEEHL